MSFDYNESLWGKGTARLNWSSPTSFRLSQALKAVKILPASAKVMEIGCGLGQFIRAIKQARPELMCYGSDISETAITQAQALGDGVEYALSTPDRLPYADQELDMVLIFDVLEHVPDPVSLLKESHRVLKPGGRLYAFVPCEDDCLSLWHWLHKLQLKNDLTKKYAGHIQYFSRQSLKQTVQAAGFEILEVRYGEHLLGQLLNVMSFKLMHRAATAKGLSQLNNEAYFAETNNQSGGVIMKIIKHIVNSSVNIESRLLCRFPSPNVHLIAKKTD